jgi:alpha-glucosidase
MNLEYDKWDRIGITPDHELTVPFTRMLAGPLDFHQGSFRAVKPAVFQPRNEAPLVIGTPARTLASYVVYQNHLSMVADYPTAYRAHAGLPILAAIPTTWDDTKVIDASVGEFIVIARRSGTSWYVGAMTDRSEREFSFPLGFLREGRFQAEIVTDDETAKNGLSIRRQPVEASDTVQLKLTSGGGGLLRITGP